MVGEHADDYLAGWCNPAWTPTRWPPSNDWSPRKRLRKRVGGVRADEGHVATEPVLRGGTLGG